MRNIGLKLWSSDLKYFAEAERLFSTRQIQYIELFVVPGSTHSISQWQKLQIPCILHAPHSAMGLNFADPSCKEHNLQLVKEVDEFFMALTPKFTIFHPGTDGNLRESTDQFLSVRARYPNIYQTMLIENKPIFGIEGQLCLGASPESLRQLLRETGLGFCFDFGHAICYAVGMRTDYKVVLREFLNFRPKMFHLSDGSFSIRDEHEHLGAGEFDFSYLAGLIDDGSFITLETKKNTPDSLADFVADVEFLRRFWDVEGD